ncbi:DNA-directed RNA polymerase sigma-70 factor [Brucella endophytica]|uniref:DNA-directed RNA polymerase sigma-70 factor n=1 Tax=Brucella endophytica TaxID=1963359 RepID=A0A916S7S8_9HYPH|nr:sigma-70 family RNA polymerase sigma factor [Brucella endophytica]GGA87736.1 DNA-directed RNA polymerase sigma-70 factor [Brucella endophytica]
MKEGDGRLGLYFAHRVALIDYAKHLVGSRETAEDVVQEAFLKFVPANVEPASSPKSYLFRIVRNLALDFRRRRQTERRWEEEPPDWVTPPPVANPEQATLFCEELRQITSVLSRMPEDVRIAVEMHRYGGYKMEDIAAHLGISVPTVHRMIRKAIAEITDHLGRNRQ